ncbi:MAG: ABC transporter ATP-binding protein, partial [Christensenellaceae bacterium]
YAQEDSRLKAFTVQSEQMRDANLDLTATSSLLNPLIQIFFGLSAMLSLIYGGMLTQSGAISVGDFTAFFSYLTLMMAPVMAIGRIVNLLQRGLASMRRLNSLLEQPTIPLMEEGEAEPPLQGNLSVRHLTFSYPRGDRNVLTDVSFELPQGKLLGVTGVTGSGKSTLLYLLLKFYRAPEGTIFIDGRDIRDLPARAVRELVGYVPQDGFLFNTTVEENIRFFNRALSYEELIAASRDAGLAGHVEGFPQGYQTPTGERGNHLSGGQQQRLAIARALALDPRILILDDSLSAVDTQTEHAILSRLRERLKGRTAIIVAHRLSALEHCDEILVLDGGRIAERGDHASLIRLDGRYAQLYRQQHERKEAAHE